ncbi:MAG TPA: HEAT repeat domain-containing protein [Pirellulales bacterium]|nr:HEAT repeat domain-containing protein [Pirellulales bacterium]
MQVLRIIGSLSLPVMLLGCAPQKPDALRQSISDINNTDSRVAQRAIDDLADAGPKGVAAVPQLAKALANADEGVRWRAARALETIGPKAKSAAPALLKALKDEDAAVRAHAARALGMLDDRRPSIVDGLASLITDPDAQVRRAAISALARLEPGQDVAIPLMVKALEDADPSVKLPALQSLAEGGAEAVPALVEALGHRQGRYWATLVLAEMGPAAKDATPALAKLLEDPDPEVRMQAAMALGAIGADAASAQASLMAALADKTPAVRYASAFALGQARAADALPALEKAEGGDDAFLAMISGWAVAKIKPDDASAVTKAVELIVAGLKSKDANLREGAAKALLDLNAPRETVGPPLMAALDDPDPEVQENVARALASLGEAIVPRVVERLKDPASQDRALRVFSRMGPSAAGAVPTVVELLGEADAPRRRDIVLALGSIGPAAADATTALVPLLHDSDEDVRVAAAFALANIGPAARAAVDELQKHLKSKDQLLRLACAEALLRVQPDNAQTVALAVPVLVGLVQEGKTDVTRQEAAAALGDLGAAAKSAAGALQRAQNDPSPAVREAVHDALAKIRG